MGVGEMTVVVRPNWVIGARCHYAAAVIRGAIFRASARYFTALVHGRACCFRRQVRPL